MVKLFGRVSVTVMMAGKAVGERIAGVNNDARPLPR
jgi:hypothetical protein